MRAQALVDEREVERISGEPRRNAPVPAFLRVEILGAEKGLVRIVLPQPALPVGETALVREGTLQESTR